MIQIGHVVFCSSVGRAWCLQCQNGGYMDHPCMHAWLTLDKSVYSTAYSILHWLLCWQSTHMPISTSRLPPWGPQVTLQEWWEGETHSLDAARRTCPALQRLFTYSTERVPALIASISAAGYKHRLIRNSWQVSCVVTSVSEQPNRDASDYADCWI